MTCDVWMERQGLNGAQKSKLSAKGLEDWMIVCIFAAKNRYYVSKDDVLPMIQPVGELIDIISGRLKSL